MQNVETKMISLIVVLAAGLALAGGCGDVEDDPHTEAAETVDDREDSFVAGLEESGATTESSAELSAEERGVLELVNEASFEVLDDDVGLDVRAAENIVEYRKGEDGEAGTDQDRTFESFDELDQIAWVGPYAFDQLLEYADEHGYIGGQAGEVHGITIGSDEEDGVLSVANEAGIVELDGDVNLDIRAATNIVDYRTGDDDTPGTDQDRHIETLGELDEISWVGPYAFEQILDYAVQTGRVDGTDAEIHGIEVGSNEAVGVVALADEASFEVLDDDVGLDVRAAENIVDYRDSETIDTLSELDGISWVAERAFGRLLDYAYDHQYVPAETWRDIFEIGAVDATYEVTAGSCTKKRCNTDYRQQGNYGDVEYYWYCNSYSRDYTDYEDRFHDIRVHGENPGELVAEYDDGEQTWTDSVASDGSFTLNLEDQTSGWSYVDRRGYSGELQPDYSHEVSYTMKDGAVDTSVYASRDELHCSLTYELKSD